MIGKAIPGAPHEVWLVLDATTGQNAIHQAKVFSEALGVTGIVLTKLDGTAKGGAALAVRQELGVPIVWLGVGEGIDDIRPFSAAEFASALLGEDRDTRFAARTRGEIESPRLYTPDGVWYEDRLRRNGGRMESAQGRTQDIVGQYKLHASDTGSPEVQVALLSATPDRPSHRALQDSRQRSPFPPGAAQARWPASPSARYLRGRDFGRYKSLIERLGLRGSHPERSSSPFPQFSFRKIQKAAHGTRSQRASWRLRVQEL